MCGIVGAISHKNIVNILVDGLKRLEYRGYDSCGVAVLNQKQLTRTRSVKRVSDLEAQVNQLHLSAEIGIAHTRWATHGIPETYNAHPHFSDPDETKARIALVHNGIIENYESIRTSLQEKGRQFVSDTDSEVIAHLIDDMYEGDIFEAVTQAVKRLKGAYSIAVICKDEPEKLIGARFGSPLVVGLGTHENFLASDALALAQVTNQIIYIQDGDIVCLDTEHVIIHDADNHLVQRDVNTVTGHDNAVSLGPYQHYMQKEIFEQPRALGDTLQDILEIDPIIFGDAAPAIFKDTRRIIFLACGTSYYAALTAKYWIESIAKIHCDVEIASEFRYRDPIADPDALVITISQSGETADTLTALAYAKHLGMLKTLTICNVKTSAMVRECTLHFITKAGVEIGVASTKAFTTQLLSLFLLALSLAKSQHRLSIEQENHYLKQIRHLPSAVSSVLNIEPQIKLWANQFANKENALFLGRGIHYPIALEGALKLKEISYIHAEAYPAGELKHGPLALITEQMPVVTVAPNDELLEKLKSNMQEVRARGGKLYIFADADSHIIEQDGTHVIKMPEHYGKLSPILHTVALQLLAYHTAVARGTDVDKPRNLAKSVTVE
ncbi:glutamine--fructose-6-phosphate transaminase (isomerizing) [Basilea psittacipulmonis]|uniref:Glutamine--fructose-6-phosphate aminotransferase [isomerizing] n=1 Tax=Basilea psittacipulmonis DSM 24701 TaxID=1072685 RepID=A0A077DES3_9BURK|nr:glutamine--fructose-6-phosphate transaminase (isomerizing) [Basilea psittacipulmonis]AIL33340.1 glucosamine--fructose-6-phosphate aminotransferase [Basilea psittacipulmonis DSM 24701]